MGSGSVDARTSNRSWIALETLLMFCPPAPWARMAENSISSSRRSKRIVCVTGCGVGSRLQWCQIVGPISVNGQRGEAIMTESIKFTLDESRIPKYWYNLAADLPKPLPPVLHPGTLKPLGPD